MPRGAGVVDSACDALRIVWITQVGCAYWARSAIGK
jgi:hypothetical protein